MERPYAGGTLLTLQPRKLRAAEIRPARGPALGIRKITSTLAFDSTSEKPQPLYVRFLLKFLCTQPNIHLVVISEPDARMSAC